MRILHSEHPRPLDLLAVGSGGHVAAAWSEYTVQGRVEVWNLSSGAIVYEDSDDAARTRSFAFTPDGRFLVVAQWSAVGTVDLTVGQGVAAALPPGVTRPELAVFPDGVRVLVTAHRVRRSDTGRVACGDLSSGRLFRELWHAEGRSPTWYTAPAVSPDGRSAADVQHFEDAGRPRQAIQVRDAADGTVRCKIPHDAADPVEQLAFTADSTKLLARFHGRTVRAWDAETGEPAGEMVHKGRPFVTGLAVHPSGKAIVTSRNDGTAWFWDPATFRPLRSFDWKVGKLVSVAFSPDGSLAAAGTDRGQVVVWDVDL